MRKINSTGVKCGIESNLVLYQVTVFADSDLRHDPMIPDPYVRAVSHSLCVSVKKARITADFCNPQVGMCICNLPI